MKKFDPLGWIENIVPMPWLHRIIRATMVAIVLVFLVLRIRQYHNFFWKTLWLAETLLFVVLLIAFLVRRDPVDRSRGIREILIPLIGSALPFLLLLTRPNAWITENINRLAAIFLCMTMSTGFTAWAMWVLRHSFSITVEARSLVTRGPFQWVRHPVYLGEMLSATAVVVWRWSWMNTGILLLFGIIQLLRSRWEESKLMKVFPDYRVFAAKSRWFWNA
jgi:protein-S-isoprenylcysteine O-methyltransferase Ste14